jgi:hypothetical protein
MMAIIARTTPTITGVSHAEGTSAEDEGVEDMLEVGDKVFIGGRVVAVVLAMMETAVLVVLGIVELMVGIVPMVLKIVGLSGVIAVVLKVFGVVELRFGAVFLMLSPSMISKIA